MPPCAQTECERLTGHQREQESTGTLASQSLMTVISPASPPPTTMTRRTAPEEVRTIFLVATSFVLLRCASFNGCGVRSSAMVPLRGHLTHRGRVYHGALLGGRRVRVPEPRQLGAGGKVDGGVGPQDEDERPENGARDAKGPLGTPRDENPPGKREGPHPVGEMDDRGGDPHQVADG